MNVLSLKVLRDTGRFGPAFNTGMSIILNKVLRICERDMNHEDLRYKDKTAVPFGGG